MKKPPVFHWIDDLKKDIKTIGMGLWIFVALQLWMGFKLGLLTSDSMAEFASLVVSVVSGMCVILFLKTRFKIDLKENSKIYVKEIVQGFSVMLLISFVWGILSIFIDMILTGMGLPMLSQDIAFGYSTFGNVCLFIAVVFVAPVVEECIFRGLIFKKLSEYHTGFAMVCSSICFACMHMNIVQGIPTFFMGLVLAYSYWKTQSLKTSIGIHLLNNAFGMLAMVWDIGFFALILDVLGVYILVSKRKEILTWVQGQTIPREYFAYFVKSPIIQGFFVLFLIMAVFSLL